MSISKKSCASFDGSYQEERGAPLYTVESTSAFLPWEEHTIKVNELELEKDISSTSKEFYKREQITSTFKFSLPRNEEKWLLRSPKMKGTKSVYAKKNVPMTEMPGSELYSPRSLNSGSGLTVRIDRPRWKVGVVTNPAGMLASKAEPIVPEKKRFFCKLCPKIFYFKSLLSRHVLEHDLEVINRNLYCKICWKKYSCMTDLKEHIQLHLKREKPFKCSYCGKNFAALVGLERHTRIHTGVKPFQCNQCSRRFVQKGHLTRHLRFRENEKSKPIKCEQCCRRFSSRRAASKHTRVHILKKIQPITIDMSKPKLGDTADLTVVASSSVLAGNKISVGGIATD